MHENTQKMTKKITRDDRSGPHLFLIKSNATENERESADLPDCLGHAAGRGINIIDQSQHHDTRPFLAIYCAQLQKRKKS